MTGGGSRPSRGRPRLDWKAVLGILISAGLLWYVFRDVDLAEVWGHIQEADLFLLFLSAVAVTLPFPLRALRWRPLLRPAYAGTRFRPRFAATAIGFMANNLLPARVGEFARAYALSRLEPVRLSASFGSLVVERVFDGVMVVLLLLLTLLWPAFPDASDRNFETIALWMGAGMLALFGVLLAMVIRPKRSVRWFEATVGRLLPERLRQPVVDTLETFIEGLAAVRNPRLVLEVFFWSLLVWLAAGLGTWLGLLAFGIDLPFIAGVFLQSVIALAVALPSAPGFFGVFEAAARVGLVGVWGVESSSAVAFAVGFHLAGFIPVTVIGLYYLWRLGLSWSEVEASDEVVEGASEEESAAAARTSSENAGDAQGGAGEDR